MGNTASYPCFSVTTTSKPKTAILLDTQGNIRDIKLPIRSAELMIQELGHVISPMEELRRTRRISALPADRELVPGKVYLLVPVSRVHSKASKFEIEIAEQWGCEKKKSGQKTKAIKNMAKVSPLSKDGEIEVSSFPWKITGITCHQLPRKARWNPALEPIFETSRDFSQQF